MLPAPGVDNAITLDVEAASVTRSCDSLGRHSRSFLSTVYRILLLRAEMSPFAGDISEHRRETSIAQRQCILL